MPVQQNRIVQPTYNGQDIYYRTPVDAIITDGMSLDDYIRNTTGVVESGENSNGRYIKFADGTMICQGSKTFTSVACTTGYGGLYRSSAGNQMNDFPVEFYNIPIVNFGVTEGSASGNNSNTGPIVIVFMKTNTDSTNIYVPTKTNPGRVSIAVGASQTIPTITISYTAIGRWKDYDVSVLPDAQQSTIINSSSTNYSYEEKVIGLWMDFKPLYRKMFYSSTALNISANTWTNLFSVSTLNIERLVGGDVLGDQANTNTFGGSLQISGGYLQAYCPFDYGNFHYAYIEYTKTSDSPVTSQTKDILTVVNGKDISDLDTIIKQRVDQVIHESLAYDRLGKLLWSGSFTSGTLNVPGISKYKVITVRTANLMMIGNQYYGGLAFRAYRSQGTAAFGYRYTYDATAETLTTTTDNPGATDGTNNIAITEIYGIF